MLIIAGLYLVLWGKSEERGFAIKEAATASISSSCDHEGLQQRPVPTPTMTASFKASSLTQPLVPSENA